MRKHSKGEREIIKYLKNNNIEYQEEVSFDNLVSKKNHLLRFDFLVFPNILIETQGQHHYSPVNKYPRAKRVHETTKYHDLLKKEFAKNNGYFLIEIPFKFFDKVQQILPDLLDQINNHDTNT